MRATASTSTEPSLSGRWKSMFSAIAAPNISASAVEIEAAIDENNMMFRKHGLKCSVVASERHLPVTMPRCAALCCKTININVESVTIQSSAYPYCDPAAMFDAQLPGSMNPTVTSRPGPRYLRNAAALLLVS